SVRALFLGIRLSVTVDISVSGKAARATVTAEVDPGDGRLQPVGEKHGVKYLIMREQVFGIGDDHWVTFRE
ncbi:hypothetical protein QBC40DRAFT_189181, partial [Triangularia verruculosa]